MVFTGLVVWAGEVAHAVESTAQFEVAIAADGIAPIDDDCVARHLDEGGAGRRADVDACGVIPAPIGESTTDTGTDRSLSECQAHEARHLTTRSVRGPPDPA